MDLLIASNTVADAARDIAPLTGTPQWATDGNPAASPVEAATEFPAYHYNMVMAELCGLVDAAGLARSGSDWTQILSAVLKISQVGPWSASTAEKIGGYPQSAIVSYNGVYYQSTISENSGVPGAAASGWELLFSGLTPTATGKSGTGSIGVSLLYLVGSTGSLWANTYDSSGNNISKQIISYDQFKTVDNGSFGYRIAPDGHITQWGTATLPASGSVTSSTIVEFPVQFPSRCVSVKPVALSFANSTAGCWPSLSLYGAPGQAACNIIGDTLSHYGSSPTVFDQTVSVQWIAEGF